PRLPHCGSFSDMRLQLDVQAWAGSGAKPRRRTLAGSFRRVQIFCNRGWRDRESFGQRSTQFGETGAVNRTDADRRNVTTAIALDAGRHPGDVALVEHADLCDVTRADLGEQRIDRFDLLVAIVGAGVNDVQQE